MLNIFPDRLATTNMGGVTASLPSKTAPMTMKDTLLSPGISILTVLDSMLRAIMTTHGQRLPSARVMLSDITLHMDVILTNMLAKSILANKLNLGSTV